MILHLNLPCNNQTSFFPQILLRFNCLSSGVQKDIQVDDMSVPASWGKIAVSELCRQASQHLRLHNNDIAKDSVLENRNSPSLALDVGDKLVIGRTCEIPRSNSLCSKRSGMVLMEVSDSKSGLLAAEGMSLELASCPASSNTSEKTQVTKQRKSSLVKRGDKSNGKILKNRCDSISLKNSLVSFNSAAGGNIFFSMNWVIPNLSVVDGLNFLSCYESK